jgi:hypothetical protein
VMALEAVPTADHLTDQEAARALAEFHRDVAAQLPPESRTRAAPLRCAVHWSRIGGCNRLSGLAAVDGDDERRNDG